MKTDRVRKVTSDALAPSSLMQLGVWIDLHCLRAIEGLDLTNIAASQGIASSNFA